MELFEWFKNKSAFADGYDYVLHQIELHGESAIQRLEVEADNAFDFGDFERGMNEALREIQRK